MVKKLVVLVLLMSLQGSVFAGDNYRQGVAEFRSANYANAVELFKRDLNEKVKKYGSDHYSVASTYTWLGLVNNTDGQFNLAIGFYQKA